MSPLQGNIPGCDCTTSCEGNWWKNSRNSEGWQNFDERVCKEYIAEKLSCNQNFSPLWMCNNKLKMEGWKLLVPKTCITVNEILDQILLKFKDIDTHVKSWLCFQYHEYAIATRRKMKEKYYKQVKKLIKRSDNDLLTDWLIRYPNPDGSMTPLSQPLNLKYIHLHVCVPRKVYEQCNLIVE